MTRDEYPKDLLVWRHRAKELCVECDRLTAEVERLKAENEQIVALSVLTNEKVAHIKTINAQLVEAAKELISVPASDTTRVLHAWDKLQAAIRAAEEAK